MSSRKDKKKTSTIVMEVAKTIITKPMRTIVALRARRTKEHE